MDYEINEGTLAVVALGSSKSKILEDKREYIVDNTPFEIIDYSCKYFGSSYEGRKEGTKSILHVDYKVPIIVESSNNLIFFPTSSPYSQDCCWISLKDIKKVQETKGNRGTEITFYNNKSIIIPVSKRMIDNQILRASRLDLIIRNRKNEKNS